MAGKVTSLEGIAPKPPLRKIVSYEQSPMYARINDERYNPDELATRKGLAVYRKMMTDEQIKAVMHFKRDAITARGWHFKYAHKQGKLEDQYLERIAVMERVVTAIRGSFEDGINAIARGRQYGFSMTEVVYDTLKIDGKNYMAVHSLQSRDPATFVFHTDKWGVLQKVVQKIGSEELDVDYNKFIHYVQNPEEDAYYGLSDLRQCYRSWYAKDQIIKLYTTFLERFAGGFAVMSLGEMSGITAGSREHTDLQSILSNIRNLAGILLPPGVTIDVMKPNSTAEYREALTYFDLAIAKSLLVPNLLGLSHTGQTGSFSQSQTQLEAFFWTLNADTRRLEATLNEQLFRRVGDMNWGDGDYPEFRFKPASNEHVKWLIGTWKDLVGARAVTTTDEDEAHLRSLLDMPAREVDEDEYPDPKNPKTSLDGAQVTAMLEVLAKVRIGEVPKESAIQLLVESFPITEEQASAMVKPITIKEPEPLPSLGVAPRGEATPRAPAESTGRSRLHVAEDGSAGAAPPIAAHTHNGEPLTVSKFAFDNAVRRVEFAIIDRRTAVLAEDVSEQLARLVARSTRRVLMTGDQRIQEILGGEIEGIENMRLEGQDVGKIKATAKEGLVKGWGIGVDAARSELKKSGRASMSKFADLRDRASEYFEANAFRMAANIADGTRSIIQQQLIQAIKQGSRPEDTAAAIFASLSDKGFTTVDAIERELSDPDMVDRIRNMLGLPESASVAAYLNTLARTNIFEAMNEARYAEFTDPSLEGYVVAMEYSAILDSRTTELCRELDGKVFEAGSEEWDLYRPPNHYNCRSVLIPITEIDEWDGQVSDRPANQPADGFGVRA